MTHNKTLEEGCKHEHFSPVCNSCGVDMLTTFAEKIREGVVEEVEKMNNFRQAKIDGKEDWNMALEQSASKVDALLAQLKGEDY